MSGVNPGVRMAERIYNFCKKYHPKTNVMVSGVRKPAGLHVMTHSCEYLQERKQDAMLVLSMAIWTLVRCIKITGLPK